MFYVNYVSTFLTEKDIVFRELEVQFAAAKEVLFFSSATARMFYEKTWTIPNELRYF